MSVYPNGTVDAGGTYTMDFTSASAILAYLPAVGTANALTSNVGDPTTTVSGLFGGDVLALSLDIAFSDAGKLAGTTGYAFGDLTLCGLSPTSLNGQTIRQYPAIVNALLGGGSSGGFTGADIPTLDPITDSIAGAFNGGSPSTFAQQHLFNGACP
ncbi:MAG TPA: hypothetical protein VGS20_01635 [Candidatus Acidoferrales bacterium]|nr:hypothetical protein [Candidatus Acidoferrales bacterium]